MHPLAYEQVNCKRCGELLHAANNECMQTWVETGKGDYRLICFIGVVDSIQVIEDGWGLTGTDLVH